MAKYAIIRSPKSVAYLLNRRNFKATAKRDEGMKKPIKSNT